MQQIHARVPGAAPAVSERSFFVPKEVLDTVNSVSWFLMDACWMLQAPNIACFLILPTVLTGLCLLYIEKRRPVFFINLAINCWIGMNTLWMLSEFLESDRMLDASRALFGAGVVFILLAARYSESLMETFSHFKRFRVLKL